jgi:tetratricopeptide (TPR) repeat protein
MRLWPIKTQWRKWSLPSKASYVGCVVGIIAILLSTLFNFLDSGQTIQHNYYGIPVERFQKISSELGITKTALKNFLKIIDRKQVPIEELDHKLREIAYQYKELQKKLANFESDDPVVVQLKRKAKKHLDVFEYDAAEQALNKASKKDLEAAQQLKDIANKRLLSAAESKAENGELKLTQLDYQGAVTYFREASNLVPKELNLLLARYLNRWGLANLYAGDYDSALRPLKRSLEIR